MNDDLISRKYIQDQISELDSHDDGFDIWLKRDDVEELIDKAPTVEYTFEDAFQKTVCENKLYCPAKPQGEWIIIDDTEHFIAKCSICGRIEDSRMVKDYPFCHCGVKMRGGAK